MGAGSAFTVGGSHPAANGLSRPRFEAGSHRVAADVNGPTHSAWPRGVSTPRPAIGAERHLHRRELERQIDLVRRRSDQIVDEDPVARLDEQNAAPMHDRIAAAAERIVLCIQKIQLGTRVPFAQSHPRALAPPERSGRLGLSPAVDDQRAVRRGAAKEVAPFRIRRVAEIPAVNEARFAEDRALNAQQIRVSMSAAPGTAQWTDVHDHLAGIVIPLVPHDGVAAHGKRARGRTGRRHRMQRVEGAKAIEPHAATGSPARSRSPPRRSRIDGTSPPPSRTCRPRRLAGGVTAEAACHRLRRRWRESIHPVDARRARNSTIWRTQSTTWPGTLTPLLDASSRKCR